MTITKFAVDTARKFAADSVGSGLIVTPDDRYKMVAGAALSFLALCEVANIPTRDAGQFLNEASQALERWKP